MRETFAHNALPLGEGQTRIVVDVRYPAPLDRHWEQNHSGSGTSGLIKARQAETVALLVDQQNRMVTPPKEPPPPHVRPPSRCSLPQPVEGPMPFARPAIPLASPTTPRGQTKPRTPRQVNDGQRLDKPPDPAVFAPVERPQTVDEPTPPVPMVQELNKGSAPIQRRNLDKFHLEKGGDEEDKVSRKEGCVQDPFPGISWEGWGLIKTPHGIYLPETFNPFPHELEDLTDQR